MLLISEGKLEQHDKILLIVQEHKCGHKEEQGQLRK